MTIKLNRVKATLKPYRTLKSVREGRGEGADPVEVTELELAIDVGGEGGLDPSFDKTLAEIFGPQVLTQIKGTPGRDPAGGFDMSSRSKLPDLAISFFDFADSGSPVIAPSLSSVVRSRPKLKVTEQGVPVLELRRVVYRPEAADVAKLHPYIGADFFVTIETAQVDMSEITDASGEASDAPATTTRSRKGRQIGLVGTDGQGSAA